MNGICSVMFIWGFGGEAAYFLSPRIRLLRLAQRLWLPAHTGEYCSDPIELLYFYLYSFA